MTRYRRSNISIKGLKIYNLMIILKRKGVIVDNNKNISTINTTITHDERDIN